MTVLQGNEVRGFTGIGRRLVVDAALVLLGLGAAFGISRIADQDTSTYEGPMVERSRAMQYNTGALLEGNWPAPIGAPVAQIFIDGIADTYAGPLVDRSLAMEDFYKGQEHFRRQNSR